MHLSVLWRWRLVVAGGIALAIVLTFFSFFKVGFAHGLSVKYRQGKTWQSSETLLLKAPGCQICTVIGAQGVDQSTLTALPPVYATLANSQIIRQRVLPQGSATAVSGDYTVTPVVDSFSGTQQTLPFLQFDGTASSAAQAVNITRRASAAFLAYLNDQSKLANIKQKDRIIIEVVSRPSLATAQVIKGRKLTIPIVVMLSVLLATIALVYVLENLFPRTTPAAEPLHDSETSSPNGSEPAAREEVASPNGDESSAEPADVTESPPPKAPQPRGRATSSRRR